MTNKQEDKLNMYDSVLTHYQKNTNIVETIPALDNAFTAFSALTMAIHSTVQQQVSPSKGHTVNKGDNRNILCSFGNDVAGILFAWAADTANEVIKEKTKTSLSALRILRDEELADVCRNYYDIALANQAALADYGLTKEVNDAFKLAIDNYQLLVATPRNAIAERKFYTARLNSLFKEADTLLKEKIDKLSRPLKKTHFKYLETYRYNRRIVNSGTNSTALNIVVTDASTNEPISKANVQIEALQLQLVTDKEGKTFIKPIPIGIYSMKVSKEGYHPQVIDEQKSILGKTVVSNVALKKA